MHVPEFQYNLLSGLQIMQAGYIQVIKNNGLEVKDKNGEILLHGKFNPTYGLIEIKLDHQAKCFNASKISLKQWHRRFAHINFKDDSVECIRGLVTLDPYTYDILEMVESDSTTFSIVSYDGFANNVKFVDRNSGYIHMD